MAIQFLTLIKTLGRTAIKFINPQKIRKFIVKNEKLIIKGISYLLKARNVYEEKTTLDDISKTNKILHQVSNNYSEIAKEFDTLVIEVIDNNLNNTISILKEINDQKYSIFPEYFFEALKRQAFNLKLEFNDFYSKKINHILSINNKKLLEVSSEKNKLSLYLLKEFEELNDEVMLAIEEVLENQRKFINRSIYKFIAKVTIEKEKELLELKKIKTIRKNENKKQLNREYNLLLDKLKKLKIS